MKSVKLNKKMDDWVIATYCDYGKNQKEIIKKHYSLDTANRAFVRLKGFTNKGTWRCWQETRDGKIINDTNKNCTNAPNKKVYVVREIKNRSQILFAFDSAKNVEKYLNEIRKKIDRTKLEVVQVDLL